MISPAERAAYAALLERQAAEWQPVGGLIALSLSYHLPVTAARIRYDMNRFHTHMDRELLGPRFYKRKSHERSRFWAVIESKSSTGGVIVPVHRHVHAGWKMPPTFGIDDFRRVMDKYRDGSFAHGGLWLRFAGRGTYDAQTFRFRSESERGWGAYSVEFLTDPDDILQSVDFLR